MSWEVFPLLFFVFWVFKNIYFKTVFTFGRAVLGAVCGLSPAVKSRTPSSLGAWASLVAERQLSRSVQESWHTGLVALQRVEPSRARNWTPVPALVGGFLTTGPPGRHYVSVCLCQACRSFQLQHAACLVWQADSYLQHVGSVPLTSLCPLHWKFKSLDHQRSPPSSIFFEEFDTSWNFYVLNVW